MKASWNKNLNDKKQNLYSCRTIGLSKNRKKTQTKPLSTNFTKCSNIVKQFIGKMPTNCLSVFDRFVGLALKGLINKYELHTRKYKSTIWKLWHLPWTTIWGRNKQESRKPCSLHQSSQQWSYLENCNVRSSELDLLTKQHLSKVYQKVRLYWIPSQHPV